MGKEYKQLNPINPYRTTQKHRENHTMKITAISDTHGKHRELRKTEIPEADTIIHAGDFTKTGTYREAKDFINWFGNLNHKHKILVAGNHDHIMGKNGSRQKKELLNLMEEQGITYLENNSVEIENLKFYGTPYSKIQGDYVFNQEIPEIDQDTDILITHGPVKGILDHTKRDGNVGSEELREEIGKADPREHIHGHIHEQHGQIGIHSNVSILNEHYRLTDNPIVLFVGE